MRFLMMLSAALAAASGGAIAQTDQAAGPPQGFQVKPVVLDATKLQGATIALEYKYARKWSIGSGDSSDSSADEFDFGKVRLGDGSAEVRGSGTVATSADRNPNKLLDLGASFHYDRSLGASVVWGVGGRLKVEGDQSWDNRQLGYMMELHTVANNPFGPRGWFMGYLNVGRVDPKADKARETALAGRALDGYNRCDLEAIYHLNLKGRVGGTALHSLELQYRHFQEIGAPVEAKQAGIDRKRLGTIRLNALDGLFVAYSRGALPFDKQSDRAVKLGWTYKIK